MTEILEIFIGLKKFYDFLIVKILKKIFLINEELNQKFPLIQKIVTSPAFMWLLKVKCTKTKELEEVHWQNVKFSESEFFKFVHETTQCIIELSKIQLIAMYSIHIYCQTCILWGR